MSYNYSALLGKIVETFGTQAKFAEALGISEHTVSLRLNGKRQWKQEEILRASSLLHIPKEEIVHYFFTLQVQDIEPTGQKEAV